VHGGKRLRPAFAYWGWRAAGGSADKTDAVITAAAAIELVHASALTHDDVMDDSFTRHGSPAAHRAFGALRSAGVDPARAQRFGRSAAILLGDLLLSWSDELLGQADLRPRAIRRGRVYFDKLRTEVVAGQYLDVLAQASVASTGADAMRVVRYKAAKYTVERPLQFGAALARAGEQLQVSLSSYGVPLGEAFQLRDDVLGVFGEAEVTGKPSGDDIREGKRTLLVARAFDMADPEQARVLERAVGNPDLDEAGIAAVQQVLRDCGALAAVETVIAELTTAALSALRHAPVADEETRAALRVLADRVTNRAH
jgi:geranylgeranyl diphosphate synthase, type I